MKLGELLNTEILKSRVLVTVNPQDSIAATIQKLAEHSRYAMTGVSWWGSLPKGML